MIDDGHDGLLVPEGDEDGLAAALRALVADPERRRALGDAAARTAAAYTPATVGRRWDGLLAELTGTPPARRRGLARHYDDEAKATIRSVRRRTMTAEDKLFALIVATRHVADHRIPGAIVECGVWRGGSMQAVARTLLERGAADRELHLFDTFAGMPPPQDVDRRYDGRPAAELLAERDRSRHIWAIADLDDVRAGMAETGYPAARVHLHAGLVEETIPGEAPGRDRAACGSTRTGTSSTLPRARAPLRPCVQRRRGRVQRLRPLGGRPARGRRVPRPAWRAAPAGSHGLRPHRREAVTDE